jgi:hypothetical protein
MTLPVDQTLQYRMVGKLESKELERTTRIEAVVQSEGCPGICLETIRKDRYAFE